MEKIKINLKKGIGCFWICVFFFKQGRYNDNKSNIKKMGTVLNRGSNTKWILNEQYGKVLAKSWKRSGSFEDVT